MKLYKYLMQVQQSITNQVWTILIMTCGLIAFGAMMMMVVAVVVAAAAAAAW